jgi:5'-nucleotidase
MRILVCNDDGIEAPGLRLAAAAARALTGDVWVVAPERKWTAASHQLSFDRVLTLSRVASGEHACSGAPADCVVAAMTLLFKDDAKPDLVVAGVNDKINVAEDIAYSGTMAVAREATFWGIPAIALSSDSLGNPVPFEAAQLGALLEVLWQGRGAWSESGAWLSLNLPGRLPAPLVQARVGRDKMGAASEIVDSNLGRTSFRMARGRPGSSTPGDERSIVAAGAIAVVRHRTFADAPLPDNAIERWNRALS